MVDCKGTIVRFMCSSLRRVKMIIIRKDVLLFKMLYSVDTDR